LFSLGKNNRRKKWILDNLIEEEMKGDKNKHIFLLHRKIGREMHRYKTT